MVYTKRVRFKLERRNKCLTLRVMKAWPKLPRVVVDVPSLEPLQIGLSVL